MHTACSVDHYFTYTNLLVSLLAPSAHEARRGGGGAGAEREAAAATGPRQRTGSRIPRQETRDPTQRHRP